MTKSQHIEIMAQLLHKRECPEDDPCKPGDCAGCVCSSKLTAKMLYNAGIRKTITFDYFPPGKTITIKKWEYKNHAAD